MARIKREDIITELEKDNWSLVTDKYINLETPMEFICDEGHHVYLPWKQIRDRRICPTCNQNQYKKIDLKIPPKKKGTFRVLGLDQATYNTGYSIFDDKQLVYYGMFETDNLDEIARDSHLKEWMLSMIEAAQIDFVGLEGIQLQGNMGVTTYETLARLQGILMEALYSLKIPYKVCPTATWRNHCGVTGKYRNDRKKSMQLITKRLYDISVPNDIADAIGIGKYAADTFSPKIEISNWE